MRSRGQRERERKEVEEERFRGAKSKEKRNLSPIIVTLFLISLHCPTLSLSLEWTTRLCPSLHEHRRPWPLLPLSGSDSSAIKAQREQKTLSLNSTLRKNERKKKPIAKKKTQCLEESLPRRSEASPRPGPGAGWRESCPRREASEASAPPPRRS